MAADFRLNMAELIAISNAVNESECADVAEGIAARARSLAQSINVSGDYAASIHVESEPRSGVGDWAHQRVVADVPYAGKVESRHGILGRAAG